MKCPYCGKEFEADGKIAKCPKCCAEVIIKAEKPKKEVLNDERD